MADGSVMVFGLKDNGGWSCARGRRREAETLRSLGEAEARFTTTPTPPFRRAVRSLPEGSTTETAKPKNPHTNQQSQKPEKPTNRQRKFRT